MNFKGLYFKRGIVAFMWLTGAIGFGAAPASGVTLVGMLLCTLNFLVCVLCMYHIGPIEKLVYVEYRLRVARREINWLDYQCAEYRRLEDDMEEEIDFWVETRTTLQGELDV